MRSGWVPRVCVPMDLGCVPSPCECVHPSGSSPGPTLFGFYVQRLDQLLTPFSDLLPSQENVGVRLKFPSFSSWLGLSGEQPSCRSSTQSHLMRTEDTPINQEITRVPGAPCQQLGSETKTLPVFLSLRKLPEFQGLYARGWWQTQITYFSTISQYLSGILRPGLCLLPWRPQTPGQLLAYSGYSIAGCGRGPSLGVPW